MNEYKNDALEASQDEEIIGLYDRKLHLEMLHNTELYEAEQRGIAKGQQEVVKEKLKAARKFLKNGVSKDIVIQSLELTKDEVDQLD